MACYRRCKQMEYVGEETLVEEESGDGGWVETHQMNEDGTAQLEEKVCELTMDDSRDEMHTPNSEQSPQNEDDDDEEAGDMEEFEESGMLEIVDPSVATRKPESESKTKDDGAVGGKDADAGDSVLHTRTYDLHITYDKYYQTPRLWIVGYDEVGILSFYFIGIFQIYKINLTESQAFNC